MCGSSNSKQLSERTGQVSDSKPLPWDNLSLRTLTASHSRALKSSQPLWPLRITGWPVKVSASPWSTQRTRHSVACPSSTQVVVPDLGYFS